ncbi:Sterol-8,7-isomerase [Melia azedarach]|uniref:Isomeliandiol synthase MOI2 n=2 Tax=Melia azedarach TaxID=155640 RepID=MOI2_MELAZ|nr:Sterol-8,7-isomerase [Melia azedarach]WBW48721.1 MOI2 [Melia azedarach]
MSDSSSVPVDFVLNFSTAALHAWNGLSLFLIVFISWFISGLTQAKTKMDRVVLCWWALTGLIHVFQEGYYVFTPDLFKDDSPNFMAEIWKEYSKGDSRYATRHTSVLTIESMASVVLGPLSLLAAYALAKAKSYNYILQFGVSIAQLYGACLYFLSAFLEGDNFASSPYFYWAYYVGQSSIWVIVPALIAIRCWKKINAICYLQDKKNKTKVR